MNECVSSKPFFITNLFVPLSRKLVFFELVKLEQCNIQIIIGRKEYSFGNKLGDVVTITVHDERFFHLVLFRGHMGFAEAYALQYISVTHLTQLLTYFAQNIQLLNREEKKLAWFYNKIQFLYYTFFSKNSLSGSRKNISKHYDLGNNLFATFLDENMQYSSALYKNKTDDLCVAQKNKLATICRRLRLTKSDHILEIGSGWGLLAIYMARNFGCRVTTVTISKEQYAYASMLIEKEKLTSLIELKLLDYRKITGKFDKIVSIEMIEAVGDQYYQQFFSICSQLLKPKGLLLLQAILIADPAYKSAKNSVDFIKRYIFPGSNIPSLNRLNYVANQEYMKMNLYSDMTHDYVKTLSAWQDNFNVRSKELLDMGYDSYFQKIWNFYFSYCQAGFTTEHIRSAHLVFETRCKN